MLKYNPASFSQSSCGILGRPAFMQSAFLFTLNYLHLFYGSIIFHWRHVRWVRNRHRRYGLANE